MTSCMPPTSSKKRSMTSVSWVGSMQLVIHSPYGSRQVFDQLLGGGLGDPDLLDQPRQNAFARWVSRQARGDFRPQSRHRLRELVGAARRLAEPERDVRSHALRVLDPHGAALDALDTVGRVAELEDVAGHALNRPVLVDAADDLVLGLQQHLVIGGVGDGSA